MTSPSHQSMALHQHSSTGLPSVDAEQLRRFHQAHFPGQKVPEVSAANRVEGLERYEDGLGYYTDGVKRTLTDEQVKMFRHSEIQRLLSERRQAQSRREEDERRQRRQDKRATRPPRFDDEPAQRQDNVDMLMYDDAPTAEEDQKPPSERKFLWPTLGK